MSLHLFRFTTTYCEAKLGRNWYRATNHLRIHIRLLGNMKSSHSHTSMRNVHRLASKAFVVPRFYAVSANVIPLNREAKYSTFREVRLY